MKKVFSNNSEVCHIWASQSQSEGEANSIFFNNQTIYSYGHHFPMAKIYTNEKTEIVLFTSKGYSVTTEKHKSACRNAITHKRVLTVYDVEANHEKNLDFFKKEIEATKIKVIKSTKNGEMYLSILNEFCKDLKDYCLFFNLAVNKEIKTILNQYENKTLINEKEITRVKTQLKEESQAKREANKAKKLQIESDLKAWRFNNGEICGWFRNEPVKLRIKDGNIETSHGAKCTFEEGQALFNAIKSGQNVVNFPVGVYYVNRIEGENIKIGCHTIALKEIESLFNQEALTN